jgi:acetylornithine/succinyldiaminopimelate/putrescine aminotransferase
MNSRHLLFDTWDQILEEQLPNFLRLHMSPYVAHTCLCLGRYLQETWYGDALTLRSSPTRGNGRATGRPAPRPEFQSFLANGFDEALSGAIKLARFCADCDNRPKAGVIIDTGGNVGPLISVRLESSGKIDFIPDIQVVSQRDFAAGALSRIRQPIGFVVLFPSADLDPAKLHNFLGRVGRESSPRMIACVDRVSLNYCRQDAWVPWKTFRPDIVVFDDSFVQRHVPFGAFTAAKTLFQHWNRKGFTGFHSTTFQPNTVASLHFLRCLERHDPTFFRRMAKHLDRIRQDQTYRRFIFARHYNPSLARATAALGWDTTGVRASGHYIHVQGRQVFDAVGGVACSIRGHNPSRFREEIENLADCPEAHSLAAERLRELTGLQYMVPAVSGASAVEHALQLGLVSQHPKNYVLAFNGGFGGKTLLALTGTAKSTHKRHIDPLYEHVLYLDPFRDNALEDLEAALKRYPVGVVQLELIQGVGGVRALPERVIRYLQSQKQRWGYLLFVDEVQTGMFRTGPFLRSQAIGLEPDLLTIGKGVSDMMFPFAVTLFGDRVEQLLQARNCQLAEVLRQRFDYEFGYKTLVNVLNHAQKARLSQRVQECGDLFEQLLRNGLSSCRAVREIRVFGLLIAIELDTRGWPKRWFRKQAGSLYVMNLLRYRPFPVFVGYCQYEPHILKITPPLSITRAEVHSASETLIAVLKRPLYRLCPSLLGALLSVPSKAAGEAFWNRIINNAYLKC